MTKTTAKQSSFENPYQSLKNDKVTYGKLLFNLKKNKAQDNTEELEELTNNFQYSECKETYWNPEKFSLLYGTPLWFESTPTQKVILNQLYWVAYYSQIISAEIATIFLNQTAAAGLYSMEDFKAVCDTLDLESAQERTHIEAFKVIAEKTENELFGHRIFTYPMKNFASETMIFQNTNAIKEYWKKIQLHFFSYLSSSNAFIASQYLTVRGLRTLNGKIVQHQLSQFHSELREADKDKSPIPSKVSYHHFLDESYHFNSSTIIGHDVVKSLPKPTAFEKKIANMALKGCQRDHAQFNVSVNGIFWYEPAIFPSIYKVLKSKHFMMSHDEALRMMHKCFCSENQGTHESMQTHTVARESYIQYVQGLDYLTPENRNMSLMKNVDIGNYLIENQRRFKQFSKGYAA
jgi:hypothetical protein